MARTENVEDLKPRRASSEGGRRVFLSCMPEGRKNLIRIVVLVIMRRYTPYSGTPSPGWRQFLAQHSDEIWGAICLRFRLSGFRHCTYSSSFITVVVNSYIPGLLHIPIRRGWRNKWSKPAGYPGNHRVTASTTVMAALAPHSIAELHHLISDRSALQ